MPPMLRWMTIALVLALGAGGSFAGEPAPSAGPAAGPSASEPAPVRKGYLLFRSEFPDPDAIKPYGRAVVPLAAKFGGRFIALADRPEPVEGQPDTRRVVILEFPSLAAARAFWDSPEYAEVKTLREGLGTVEAVLFEGT
jgi:uncharacterized protein (DUF1330 family)